MWYMPISAWLRLCSPKVWVDNDGSRFWVTIAEYYSLFRAAGRDLRYDALDVVGVVEQLLFNVQRQTKQLRLWGTYMQTLLSHSKICRNLRLRLDTCNFVRFWSIEHSSKFLYTILTITSTPSSCNKPVAAFV